MEPNHRKIDPTTENVRQAYIDALYVLSGRRDGLYTGLYQQRLRELVEADMAAITSSDDAS